MSYPAKRDCGVSQRAKRKRIITNLHEFQGTMEGIIHNSELHVLVFQHHSENRCLECSLYDLCTEDNEYESMRYDLCEKLEPGEVGHFEHVYIPKSYTDEDK